MSERIVIRRAEKRDAEWIEAFNRKLAEESEGLVLTGETVRAGVQELLENPALGCYFIAEDHDTPVGQIGLTYEWSDWRNGMFWWIQSVYVIPQVRRGGVFRKLFHEVETRALEDPGCCGLRLYVEHDNRTAVQTYRTLGLSEAPYRMMELDFTEPEREESEGKD